MKISKENLAKVLVIGFFAIVAIASASHIFAATTIEYTPLAPLPGIGDGTGTNGNKVTDLSKYLISMFQLLIGLAALLSVVMITIGGVQMMIATDSESNYKEGKKKISEALLGLFLAIAALLILYTINPKLLEFNLDISPIPASNGTFTASTTATTTQGPSGKISKLKFCYGGPPAARYYILPGTYPFIGDEEKAYMQGACESDSPSVNANFSPASAPCYSAATTETIICEEMSSQTERNAASNQ